MAEIYEYSLLLIFCFAVTVFIILFFVTAPYGKFLRRGWGRSIESKWAWMIMEFPSPFLLSVLFIKSGQINPVTAIFALLWLSHYLNRTFIYPFRQAGRGKNFPVLLVVMAFVFNTLNGFTNGFGVFHLYSYDLSWLKSWQFISGGIIFLTGFFINRKADEKFRILRKKEPSDYVLPRGWLFRYVSSPHYLGEIIEWAGWAVMTWSLPGLAFAVFTFANLFPRAIASHKWYKTRFRDYPENRKAIIPFII